MEIDSHSHGLLLRHRVFPRAMAWNVHQASQRYEDEPYYPAKAPKFDARGSPTGYRSPYASASSNYPAPEGRERLFRTIGKWLDHRPDESYRQSYPPQPVYREAYAAPVPAAPSSRPPSALYDMVKLDSAHVVASPSTVLSTAHALSSAHPSPTGSQSSVSSASRKRQRGPTGSTAPPHHANGVARPGMSTSTAKRCSVQDCGKIAVSKGLCRGHGGGRRCTFTGCTKCAQSRSPFCWAHGGGKRCEAPNCRRSRKTKRFCVDHVDMELTVPIGTTLSTDSDDSADHSRHHVASDTETVSSTSSLLLAGRPTGALHLPSLSDALKRAVPAAVARAASAQTVSLPQSRERLWPAQTPAIAATSTGSTLPFH